MYQLQPKKRFFFKLALSEVALIIRKQLPDRNFTNLIYYFGQLLDKTNSDIFRYHIIKYFSLYLK